MFNFSRAVQGYLVNEYAQGLKKELYPENPIARAKVDQMLYISETVEEATLQYPVYMIPS